ncbi:MAG: GumC family protein [Planctomycetota bacterium]
MTDLELPNLQLGRYLELLKRRRWQLVPAALLGLAVGFLVAWLIPRYYEARTTVRLHAGLLPTLVRGPREDPFLQEISKARVTLASQNLVRRAILELEDWTDFHSLPQDSEEFRAKVQGVMARIWVHDLNTRDLRSSALLEIGYRDRDPDRAADFANTIRDLYVSREKELVLGRARASYQQLKKEAANKESAWNEAMKAKLIFFESNDLNPYQTNIRGSFLQSPKFDEFENLGKALADLDRSISSMQTELRLKTEKLESGDIPSEVEVQPSETVDPVLAAELAPLHARILFLEQMLAEWKPANQNYAITESQLQAVRKRLNAILARKDVKKRLRVPNPKYVTLHGRVEELKVQIAKSKDERISDGKRYEVLRGELSRLKTAIAKLGEHEDRVKAAHDAWIKALSEAQGQQNVIARLESGAGLIVDKLTTAMPPPAPTYPNSWLIAIIGAAIGFGVAIGLILLLDFLQPTWKSFGEVARGLPIPALGGISFLELPEEIRAARLRRLRYTVVASAFVLLIGGLLAVYYLEPLRLPVGVQRFLDSLLSPGG